MDELHGEGQGGEDEAGFRPVSDDTDETNGGPSPDLNQLNHLNHLNQLGQVDPIPPDVLQPRGIDTSIISPAVGPGPSTVDLADTPSTPPLRRRTRTLLMGGVALVVIAAALVIGVVVSRGPSVPGAGVAPAVVVVSATQATLAQHTADLTIGGSLVVGGQSVPVLGTGSLNFKTHQFSGTFTIQAASQSVTEKELESNGHEYVAMDIDGVTMSQLTGGAHWVDVPSADRGSSSLGAGDVDPQSDLRNLVAKGAKVESLGTSTLGGTTVSEYAVRQSRAEVMQRLKQEIRSGAVPKQDERAALNAAKSVGIPAVDVFIDGSGVVRQESTVLAGGSSGESGTIQMTFHHYGAPVNIEAPAAKDVISFSRFLQDLSAYSTALGGTRA